MVVVVALIAIATAIGRAKDQNLSSGEKVRVISLTQTVSHLVSILHYGV